MSFGTKRFRILALLLLAKFHLILLKNELRRFACSSSIVTCMSCAKTVEEGERGKEGRYTAEVRAKVEVSGGVV